MMNVERQKYIYRFWVGWIKIMGPDYCGAIAHSGKVYVYPDHNGGCIIFPADGSYKRFISKTWYDGVDVENL